MFIFFTRLGKFLIIIILNSFSIPCSLSFHYGTPYDMNVVTLDIVPTSLKLSSLFKSIFLFLLFQLGVSHYLVFQITDSVLCFIKSTVHSNTFFTSVIIVFISDWFFSMLSLC